MAKYLYSVLTGKPLTHIADENAAFGKQVTVSGSLDQSKYGASNLVDGNPLTVWKALGFPATATIDLGSVQIVDQFRLDFGNTFGVGYDFKIEAAKNQDAWSTVLDYTARTDTASVYLESTDSIQVQFIRLTITGAAHPKGDTINVAEFKVLKANGGAHAPVIRIKKTGVSGKNIKFSVSMVMPKGSEGAGMLLRYNNTTKVSYAFRGYKIGNPPAYTEYIKTGDQNKYYASSFFNGIETLCDTVIVNTALTDVKQDDNPGIPSHIKLNSCFPNPFNPVTMISYSITPDNSGNMGTAKFMPVLLKVFNSLGQEVATLVNKEQGPGEYKVQFDAGKLPSGTYFCRLQAGDLMQVQKMVLMK
jgi:hypothetical protein